MFSKRIRKEFPPGTFIPKPARIMAILQLCIALTVLFENAGYPFMEELFSYKSEMLLYRVVMGNSDMSTANDQRSQQFKAYLKNNVERFAALPTAQKERLIRNYNALQVNANRSFLEKLKSSLSIIVFEVPLWERTWIIFSILIAIFLLLRIEGAVIAVWILPLVVALYSLDNYWNGLPTKPNPGDILFPSEYTIVNSYLRQPIHGSITEQEALLRRGWQLYLIHEWAHQEPSQDLKTFSQQAEEGEFAFDLARLEASTSAPSFLSRPFQQQKPLPLLALYLLWNIGFAWTIHQNLGKKASLPE